MVRHGPPTRGRPRDPDVERKVLDATLVELGESGPERFSLTRASQRAQVARGTVTLRWPRPELLIAEALATLRGPDDVPEMGSYAADMAFLGAVLTAVLRPETVALHLRLGADLGRAPELAKPFLTEIVQPCVSHIQQVFRRWQERGACDPTLDAGVLTDAFIGAFQYGVVRDGLRARTEEEGQRIADHFVRMTAVRPASG